MPSRCHGSAAELLTLGVDEVFTGDDQQVGQYDSAKLRSVVGSRMFFRLIYSVFEANHVVGDAKGVLNASAHTSHPRL